MCVNRMTQWPIWTTHLKWQSDTSISLKCWTQRVKLFCSLVCMQCFYIVLRVRACVWMSWCVIVCLCLSVHALYFQELFLVSDTQTLKTPTPNVFHKQCVTMVTPLSIMLFLPRAWCLQDSPCCTKVVYVHSCVLLCNSVYATAFQFTYNPS